MIKHQEAALGGKQRQALSRTSGEGKLYFWQRSGNNMSAPGSHSSWCSQESAKVFTAQDDAVLSKETPRPAFFLALSFSGEFPHGGVHVASPRDRTTLTSTVTPLLNQVQPEITIPILTYTYTYTYTYAHTISLTHSYPHLYLYPYPDQHHPHMQLTGVQTLSAIP